MASRKLGMNIGGAEVTTITAEGFTLRLDGQDHFLSFDEYPWFREATAEEIRAVERPFRGDLHWEELDVQLHEESLFHPERYPLRFDSMPNVVRDRERKR